MAEQQNPFQQGSAGQNAFKAAYERLKAESERRMGGIQSQYGNMYQNLRQQQYAQGLGAAAQRGLSGGQVAGISNRLSTQQMSALGDLSTQRQQAVLGENVNRSSIYSNALLEGQQAQEYSDRQEQTALARVTQTQEIVNDTKLSDEEKRQRLEALRYTPEQINTFLSQGLPQTNVDWWRYGAYIFPSNWGKSPETLQWEAEEKARLTAEGKPITQADLDARNPFINR